MGILYNEYMRWMELPKERREQFAMEVLADASPADILDGLYMQKTAAADPKKQMHREMNKLKNELKTEIGTVKDDMFHRKPMREAGDSIKFGKIFKAIKLNRKLALGIGAAGAGATMLAASSKKEKTAFASSLIGELYKVATITVPDKEEAKKETKPAKKTGNAQDDIECEVCDYKGQPTYDGLCPGCGAVGGVKPRDGYAKSMEEDRKEWGDPYQGISVEEADTIGRMNEGVV